MKVKCSMKRKYQNKIVVKIKKCKKLKYQIK